MEQRMLGETGITVSALGFGAGSIGGLFVRGEPEEQRRAVARALEAGITYFDTAPAYGDGRSEENLGRTLHALDAWGRVTVGTKVRLAFADLDDPVAAISSSVETSLQRLGRSSIDLLQLHNPIIANLGDDDDGNPGAVTLDAIGTAIAEGLRQVKERGLVGHVGFTGLGDAKALQQAAQSGTFETVQAYFNAINPSAAHPGASSGEQDFAGLIDTAASAHLGVIAIRVLAAGALAAKQERHPTAGQPGRPLAHAAEYSHDLDQAEQVAHLAQQAGIVSPSEMAIRFVLSHPHVSTVLVGYSDVAQLDAALHAVEQGPLPGDLTGQLVDLARSRRTNSDSGSERK